VSNLLEIDQNGDMKVILKCKDGWDYTDLIYEESLI
jgi:hypothetical protein